MTVEQPQLSSRNYPNGAPWTLAEIKLLRENAHLGRYAVAELLNRSPASVRDAARRHRISLRRTGIRSGLVMGQPRNVSLSDLPALEALAADPDVDVDDVIARAEARARREQELCPRCTRRRINHDAGICRTCWLQLVAEEHRAARSEVEAQREVWRARQERKRSGRSTPRRRTTDEPTDRDLVDGEVQLPWE